MKGFVAVTAMTLFLVITTLVLQAEQSIQGFTAVPEYVLVAMPIGFARDDVAYAHGHMDVALGLSFEEVVSWVLNQSAHNMIASRQSNKQTGTFLCAQDRRYRGDLLIFDIPRGLAMHYALRRVPNFFIFFVSFIVLFSAKFGRFLFI